MKTRLLLTIIPLTLFVLALAGGFVLMWRLFFLSLIVMLFGYLWTLASISRLEGQGKPSAKHCQAGEWLEEEIVISNRSRLPKFLIKVTENTGLSGHNETETINLFPGGVYSWRERLYCRQRGEYNVGSFTATATDPFGLFSRKRNLGTPQSILVYPATLDLPAIAPLAGGEFGSGPGHWMVSLISPDAARIREYASGDNLNRIHWRSTAHTGKLMVKVFDPDRHNYATRNIWIIADMHRDSQSGQGLETTEEYCVTFTASLLKKYVESGRPAGLIAAGNQPYLFLPETGTQHLMEMLAALAIMKADGEVPIEQLISWETSRFGLDSMIIVVTSSGSEKLVNAIRNVQSHGGSVVALLLDSTSFGGTVNPAPVAHSLTASGVRTYIIRHGERLPDSLGGQLISANQTR